MKLNKYKIVLILTTWNGIQDTNRCISSILKNDFRDYKIIVVDNGSKDNEAQKLNKIFGKKIITYRLPQNLGFTGGNNFGIVKAEKYNPEHFLLLNNDTILEKDTLEKLYNYASNHKKVGLISPLIYEYGPKKDIQFSGGYFNWLIAKTVHLHDKISKPRQSEFVTGCAILISKELFNKVGFLDDRFFAYFEDAAYSLSATKLGYKNVVIPEARIYHKSSVVTNPKSTFKTFLIARNRILFVNLYTNFIYKIYFGIFNFFKLVYVFCYFVLTSQTKRAEAYLKGYYYGSLIKGGMPQL